METAAANVAILPDDVLAAILDRLPKRSLAASWRVCRSWRAVVDKHQLLLLPRSVRGLFINYIDHWRPHFFARPTSAAGPRIDGEFSFVARKKPWLWYRILDHCNGLVLHEDFTKDGMYVSNPATQRWTRLPHCGDDDWSRAFVVFDPAVSPHYEVLVAPLEPANKPGSLEWPPSSWTWLALSSRTKRWEKRVFVREGGAAGTVAGLQLQNWRYNRLCLSNGRYKVIKSPIDLTECDGGARSFIGKSKNGIYFATLSDKQHLRVWILDESEDKRTELRLKHDSVLKPNAWYREINNDGKKYDYIRMTYAGPWIIDICWDETRVDVYYDNDIESEDGVSANEGDEDDVYDDKNEDDVNDDESEGDVNDNESEEEKTSLIENKADWDSDDDNIIDIQNKREVDTIQYVQFLRFHPYKNVILLSFSTIVVACHLNSSKVQYLGVANPPRTYNRGLFESFVYTPCMIGD